MCIRDRSRSSAVSFLQTHRCQVDPNQGFLDALDTFALQFCPDTVALDKARDNLKKVQTRLERLARLNQRWIEVCHFTDQLISDVGGRVRSGDKVEWPEIQAAAKDVTYQAALTSSPLYPAIKSALELAKSGEIEALTNLYSLLQQLGSEFAESTKKNALDLGDTVIELQVATERLLSP